jgi:hypothetical protein
MASIELPRDFKEFLRLLNENRVEYLLTGGYAVGYHGYPRATGDMDIWVNPTRENAARIVRVLIAFGFSPDAVSAEPFLKPHQIVRMGVPPVRIELLTTLSGVDFQPCYARRVVDTVDEVEVQILSLNDLKANKQAARRPRDHADLESLP